MDSTNVMAPFSHALLNLTAFLFMSVSTIRGSGDTTIPFPGYHQNNLLRGGHGAFFLVLEVVQELGPTVRGEGAGEVI